MTERLSIQRLSIRQLRNLSDVTLTPSTGVNFFTGPNGSGKTSVLEAIALLGMGRSFRSHLSSPVIQHQTEHAVVFAQLGATEATSSVTKTLGVQKVRKGQTFLRIDRQPVANASAMARVLPLQILDANSFALVAGGASERRKFWDWLMFHVEPLFHDTWLSYQKALKQRNRLLKQMGGASSQQLAQQLKPWNQQLLAMGNRLNEQRQTIFNTFSTRFAELADELLPFDIRLSFRQGWAADLSFEDALLQQQERDQRLGSTQVGPHRADLHLQLVQARGKAADMLSRGQQKVLVAILFLALADTFKRLMGYPPIYLLDDLPAELDAEWQALIIQRLVASQAQIFISAIEADQLRQALPSETPFTMFHVKHGEIVDGDSLED